MSAVETLVRERIRVGGSELLLTFLERGARLSATRLDVVAPYVEDSAFVAPAIERAWRRLVTTAQTTIVVRTTESVQATFRSLPAVTPRCRILVNRHVHAKLFVARGPHGWIVLTGSMNLTGAALTANDELGVLFTGGAALESTVRGFTAMLDSIIRRSCPVSTSGGDRNADPSLRAAAPHRPETRVANFGCHNEFRPWHK